MKTLRRILLIALGLMTVACASSTMVADSSYHAIPFRLIGGGIPIIKISLNDKEAWFIVDTGASASLVNMAVAQEFNVPNYNNYLAGRREINGLGGRQVFQSVTCKIGLGPITINHAVFKSKDLNGLFDAIRNGENLIVAGILGSDLLSRYHMSLDYAKKTLSYKINNGVRKLLTGAGE